MDNCTRKEKNKKNVRPSQQNKAVDLTIRDARAYNWRYDMVINMQASEDPVKDFRDAAIEFLEEMQKTDKSLIIILYKIEDYKKGLFQK
mmetsp:Transcript_15182/g.23120  ORF Transcript_15182/g.23120 Transcript_15182/m.23120 type:complete len:89 (-) Transcript_15182:98-364(-)